MAVMGDDAALEARIGRMEAMARDGRYPSGSYLPSLARGCSPSNAVIFPGQSTRSPRSPGKTNVSAAAARSTT